MFLHFDTNTLHHLMQQQIEERKEESVVLDDLLVDLINVVGRIKFYEQNELLMVECRFRTADGRHRFRRRLELEVAENIFDQIYLLHDTSDIYGLDCWQTIRINYLSLADYSNLSVLRLTLLTYFCEELNEMQIIL